MSTQGKPTKSQDNVLQLIGGDEEHQPHSASVEQALLGLLMLNNDVFDEVETLLNPEHFYIRFHASIYEAMRNLLSKGFEASPITIRESMKADYEGEEDLKHHLTSIMENASSAFKVRDLAEIIHNYYMQRQMMVIGADMASSSRSVEISNQSEEIQNIITETEGKLFKINEVGGSAGIATDLRNPLKNIIIQIEEVKKNKGKLVGTTSGIQSIDEKLGGFQKSDLIILAARPSMGKTAFCLNIAQNAASALMGGKQGGTAVGVFSMEMSAEQLTSRILSGAANVDSFKLQDGSLSDEEFGRLVAVSNTLADMKVFIDDQPQLPISTLRSRARRMKRQHNIGMIVVDYLQLMRGSGRRGENRVQEISEISQGLKAIARELNIPVIALSQLSRSVESRDNKRPMLSDLRESGSIEQDADIVMFLYREDYYLEKSMGMDPTPEQLEQLERVKGKTELLISKNRKGPTCTVPLFFHASTTTFKPWADPETTSSYEGTNF